MITSEQCQTFLLECEELGARPHISTRRAAAIMVVSLNMDVLARSVAEYESAVRDEVEEGARVDSLGRFVMINCVRNDSGKAIFLRADPRAGRLGSPTVPNSHRIASTSRRNSRGPTQAAKNPRESIVAGAKSLGPRLDGPPYGLILPE